MHPSDSICIEDFLIDEIINIFNKCKYFYCYDPNTFYILTAPLCGCITILYPLENYSKTDLLKNRMTCKGDYIFDSGIAYGNSNEEIEYATNTLDNSTNDFNKLLDLYKNDIPIFLESSVDEMGVMVGFDGNIHQVEQVCNFSYTQSGNTVQVYNIYY